MQNPVELSNHSEPEPDPTSLRPRDDFHKDDFCKNALPRAEDIVLAIEVSRKTATLANPSSWICALSASALSAA